MPRPRKCRRIAGLPGSTLFKPCGVPLCQLEEVYLHLDAFEALRLADYMGYGMQEGAESMCVSRHTFGRLLAEARQTVARALVQGSALCILDGDDAQHLQVTMKPLAKSGQEENMTSIAVSSEGPELSDLVDPRFGRAGGFVVVTLENGESSYLENGAAQTMAHGAGIQAAELMVNAGVAAVCSGRIGPKAAQVLRAAGVKIVEGMEGKTVSEVVKLYTEGQATFS